VAFPTPAATAKPLLIGPKRADPGERNVAIWFAE
jgi:hypothetical protein